MKVTSEEATIKEIISACFGITCLLVCCFVAFQYWKQLNLGKQIEWKLKITMEPVIDSLNYRIKRLENESKVKGI